MGGDALIPWKAVTQTQDMDFHKKRMEGKE
jgi:hypothetical protein